MDSIIERINKSIYLFDKNISLINEKELSEKEKLIVELAKDYRRDSTSWLEKNDYITSFAAIEYAHGLLDAILKLKGLIE